MFYFCEVGPVEGNVLLNPGISYRLNLDGDALRAPARNGFDQHAVLTGEELKELRRRGFSVTVMQGPFPDQKQAEDSLDSCWEEPE